MIQKQLSAVLAVRGNNLKSPSVYYLTTQPVIQLEPITLNLGHHHVIVTEENKSSADSSRFQATYIDHDPKPRCAHVGVQAELSDVEHIMRSVKHGISGIHTLPGDFLALRQCMAPGGEMQTVNEHALLV